MPGLFSRTPGSGHRQTCAWAGSPGLVDQQALGSVWEMMILQGNSWDTEAAGREGTDKRGPQEGKRDQAREAY